VHVVILTIDFSRRAGGGISTYVRTLASGLAGRGHHVTVVSPTVATPSGAAYDVVRLDARVRRERRRPELAEAFRDVVLAIHRRRPVDVVEATDYGLEGLACVDSPAFAAAGIALVVRMHTPDSVVCELNGAVRLTDSPAVHACEQHYFRTAPHLSSPSQAMAREVGRRWGVPGDRITVLPNPLDLSPLPDATAADRPAGRCRLTFLGRLEQRKGACVLAEALAMTLPDHPGLEVEFVGADTRSATGSYSRTLREILAPWGERVRFAGFLGGSDRAASLRAADVVCTPSLWENFPYACLEALACGRPVIATRGSGFDEIVEDGVDGILVPPGDAAALAAAIATVARRGFLPPPGRVAARVARFGSPRLLPRFEAYYGGLAA
jgi:glycosyltransferase involved in cell wall biosynthesis